VGPKNLYKTYVVSNAKQIIVDTDASRLHLMWRSQAVRGVAAHLVVESIHAAL